MISNNRKASRSLNLPPLARPSSSRASSPLVGKQPPRPELSELEDWRSQWDLESEALSRKAIPKEAMWVYYQNMALQRQIDAQADAMRRRHEVWTEMDAFLDELAHSTLSTAEVKARALAQRTLLKTNIMERIELENRRMSVYSKITWRDSAPPVVKVAPECASSKGSKPVAKSANLIKPSRPSAKPHPLDTNKALKQVETEISNLLTRHDELQANFKVDTCLEFVDVVRAKLEALQLSINRLS